MAARDRLEQIVFLVDERGFLSVHDLSEHFQVSEMTIRRDLLQLDEEGRVRRTYGGVTTLKPDAGYDGETSAAKETLDELLANRVDVIITSSLEQRFDYLLLDRANKKNLPIIAESAPLEKQATVVALDNYKAAFALGQWAGIEASHRWNNQVHVLDLTYRMPNTQVRSRAFMDGIHTTCPQANLTLSIDAQSDAETSYQLTRDALTVHHEVNLIFAINDSTAWGAIRACRSLSIDPDRMTVLTFGLEGDTMRNALAEGAYCKAGLAMFPEIVAPACIEAAVAACNHTPLPPQLVTPHAILTSESLSELYEKSPDGWIPRWDVIEQRFSIPIEIHPPVNRSKTNLPCQIGFIVPFSKHEWYHSLERLMQDHARTYNINLEIVDAEKEMRDEVEARRRVIACLAAEQVQPNDALIIDGGPIASHLAQCLLGKPGLTVITNARAVFNILEQDPQITLISTGGALRRSSQVLVGPTAESALRELRADKLFLSVSGISLDFGLSHTNISEVTIKQAMIRSTREVILLADYTNFGQESVAQVSDLKIVDKLITDDALPANIRLNLAKLGIKVLLASG
jgi:DeoR/GlpR family transcriptional regulator of sugar metabolism